MTGGKKLEARCRFAALAIVLFLIFQILPGGAQDPASAPGRAKSGPVPVNPNRIGPSYPIPYSTPTIASIQEILNRIHAYLDGCTPARLVSLKTNEPLTDMARLTSDAVIERGSFPIVSYEWGVTYSGMLLATEATGDPRFAAYTSKRLNFLAELFPYFKGQNSEPRMRTQISSIIDPRSLDDSGSMCASMIKARRAGAAPAVQPMIDNYIRYISKEQLRLDDGTLARNAPFPNSLWLDDLYMSVPALAQMGKDSGRTEYYDDAAKQILQFANRMYIKEKDLYMHGWVLGMDVHPVFLWARANGWAILAKTELLEVLPESHPARPRVLELLRSHIRGLAACQSGQGLWHQLLDRNDSYLETSASAMFVFCIARAINRGWVDKQAYLPVVRAGWNALTTKVNAQGQVEGTCVGTGMGFDPVWYYYRPTSILAAHGYGSVLHAGAEMIQLLKNK